MTKASGTAELARRRAGEESIAMIPAPILPVKAVLFQAILRFFVHQVRSSLPGFSSN